MFTQQVILQFDEKVQNLFLRKNGNEISFDTFFNSLNLYLLKHYTDGQHLKIKCAFDGSGTIKVFYENQKGKIALFESDKLLNEVDIDLSNLGETGIIYPVFLGNFTLKSLFYEVDAPSTKISTSIIFTTYNREDFLIPNLYKLEKCKFVDKVIIVDNAKNIKLPNDLSKNKFIVIPNDNLGGTGGFTRGMMEAKNLGTSHIFIMDDDITLLPEVVDKALSLISCLNDKHRNDWLGFSMLPNGTPTIQYELGTEWNGIKMCLNHHGMDVSVKENLWKNQINTYYNYSAWWSLIMPSSVIDKYHYPFPFFIKFDDIEYGLRRKEEEIILTNGFAVWHEDFDKKYNPYLEYYLFRNALVTNSLHNSKPLLHSLIRYLGKTVKKYFKGAFIVPRLMNIAISDFLKGPTYFKNLDIEKRNKEIRLIAGERINIFNGILTYPFRILFNFFKLVLGFKKAKKLYKEQSGSLTNETYWSGVFHNGKQE